MPQLPLIGGAYTARSIIASAQRCINLFPEKNPKDSPVPLTHYQRPGLLPLVQGVNAPVRQIYRASNGNGYCCIGQNIYSISPNWVLTLLGAMTVPKTTQVSFIDNGIDILIVDSSALGYKVNLATNAFAPFVDASFSGALKADYIDTFIIWNVLGTKNFRSTLSNTLAIDPTYIAGKTDYPDPLSSLIVNRHQILLIGQLKSEIWYDAGNGPFPFAELPGAYIEHGTGAPYSVAGSDISVFWLHQDLQGQGMVFRQRGYETKRISNHGLEVTIRKIANTVGIADAVGYTYQQDGHTFYILIFPAGNQTWAFDDSIGDPDTAWSQRCWTDQNGGLNRDRSNCYAFLYGKNVVGDWENGTLYSMDLDTYSDTVGGLKGPMSCIRTFPHLLAGTDDQGRPVMADGKRVQHKSFLADIECGLAPLDAAGKPAQMTLRWSNDRGRTFREGILQSFGEPGQYLTEPQWRGLEIARDRVYELSYSVDGPAALNGAWVEAEVLGS